MIVSRRATADTASGWRYDVALIAGNYSLESPTRTPRALANYTSQVMRNDGLIGAPDVHLFAGTSPIHHVIYIIRENRTYDQIFGDVEKSGNGQPADGDSALAIFRRWLRRAQPWRSATARSLPTHTRWPSVSVFSTASFVNSEASPDGHNWTDAAFSSDYVDKAFRWNYSHRGRTYDFQGENREPEVEQPAASRRLSPSPPRRTISLIYSALRPIPERLARRGRTGNALPLGRGRPRGLTYRTDGEEVATISQAEVDAFNANRERDYPDISPTVVAYPPEKVTRGPFQFHASRIRSLHARFHDRRFLPRSGRIAFCDPLSSPISNPDPHFRGYSRISNWLTEFRGYVEALRKGQPDSFPAFNIVYLPNDHTNGFRPHMPTPQFYVADNDYALGLLVQEVSSSPYWKDTAIFVLEDDAQNGPDHVDAHRSPALVISAYNRPGALVHQYHSTVSLIRTMELLLGMSPMNQLDASASPIDIFQAQPDLTPYQAILPTVSLKNLIVQPSSDRETAQMIRRSERQNFEAPDLTDASTVNRILWFSVRGPREPYPGSTRLPIFDVMRTRFGAEADEEAKLGRALKGLLAGRTAPPRHAPGERN